MKKKIKKPELDKILKIPVSATYINGEMVEANYKYVTVKELANALGLPVNLLN